MDEINDIFDASGMPKKAWLEQMYLVENRNAAEIGRMIGKTKHQIRYYLVKNNIPLHPVRQRLDGDLVTKMFIEDNMLIIDIAKELGTNPKNVSYALRMHGTKSKGRSKAKKTVHPSREWLVEMHFEKGVPWKTVQEMIGYGDGTFYALLEQYDIPRKQYTYVREIATRENLYQWHVVEGLTAVKIAAKLGCSHGTISKLIKEYKLDPQRPLARPEFVIPVSKETLERQYLSEKLSFYDLAQLYKCSKSTVKRWLLAYDIPIRSNSLRGKPSNRGNARAVTKKNRNGKMFTHRDREIILTRDGYCCQMPGCGCKEAWRLEVHHIIPVEYDGSSEVHNGITLCNRCHTKIRKKELQYVALFQYILNATLLSAQTCYIGETPAMDNTEGSLVKEECSNDE